MNLRRTHIPERILHSRNRRIAEQDLIQDVYKLLNDEVIEEARIHDSLHDSDGDREYNNFNFDLLERERIFHLKDIEKICINYRLRFLKSALYKLEFPSEAIERIKQIENEHDINLKGFKVMAPASVFKLKNADDPLLFAPMGNNYYYLIHSWGRDLHPFRKLLMWPYRNLENFMFSVLLLSLFLTTLIPQGMFSQEQTTTQFIILFLFMFKWITGLAIFYGFKFGKNFSSAIWRSTFSNA
ncbi:hypothetical protein FK178_07370 [Antarcticibacterium arcticum]|uniref:Uncharacterized protein n=1 Tax=Antarcticibacterium arcticum TaxID=2585771 RepID=A0A5B8YMS5_9FLAO|nr:hypothetical protein [Antarcticibacterium arcticum]QED37556.1 hypothetical protein FK178_07370 [Antarcticibacterium arcticum]